MRIVAIVQARMASSRLPGKVLTDLVGATTLTRVVRRVCRARLVGHLVVATTTDPKDDVIVEQCARDSVSIFRGSQHDVLDRYYQAAKTLGADAIVRITSDCPLIDPEVTDKIIEAFLTVRPDYASNTLDRTYPRGLDTEVMTFEALERAWREAHELYQRAHVTPYLYQNPKRFRLFSVKEGQDFSTFRWTLDTPEDLEFLRAVYTRFQGRDDFTWREALSLMDREPALAEINRHVVQKTLREG
jgi:spore coat polysaccharide biosynthesis protein SpsF